PWDVLKAMWEGFASGGLTASLLATLFSILVAVLLVILVGIPIGVVLGVYRGAYRALEPLIGFYLSIPFIAFSPLLIVWLGFGFPTVVALGWLVGVMFVVTSTALGIDRVDRSLRDMGKVYAGSAWGRSRKILAMA